MVFVWITGDAIRSTLHVCMLLNISRFPQPREVYFNELIEIPVKMIFFSLIKVRQQIVLLIYVVIIMC